MPCTRCPSSCYELLLNFFPFWYVFVAIRSHTARECRVPTHRHALPRMRNRCFVTDRYRISMPWIAVTRATVLVGAGNGHAFQLISSPPRFQCTKKHRRMLGKDQLGNSDGATSARIKFLFQSFVPFRRRENGGIEVSETSNGPSRC